MNTPGFQSEQASRKGCPSVTSPLRGPGENRRTTGATLLAGALLLALAGAVPPASGAADNRVSITTRGEYRYIQANGIPNHGVGRFPNRRNPNSISEQRHQYRVPLDPQIAERITPNPLSPFGVALNGIPFDPGAAEFWQRNRNSGWQYEAMNGVVDLGLDQNNAHVQPSGAYHYHGLPTGLIRKLGGDQRMLLLGYAADGFPIYASYAPSDPKDSKSPMKKMRSSYRIKKGTRPSGPGGRYDGSFVQDFEYVKDAGDLDECNGRFGVTPQYPDGIYHYFITDEFPYIPRCFRGTPDDSFQRHGPGGGRRGGPGFRNGRPGPPFGPPPPGGGPPRPQ